MTFALSAASLKKLQGVDPALVRVIKRAIGLSKVDFKVTCGVRTHAEQAALYAQGRTKPGPKVTWTLQSRHLPDSRGLGCAVDLLPAPYDWVLKDNPGTPEIDDNFKLMADAVMKAAAIEGVRVRWGANWDGDTIVREKGESDNPHFELAR